MWRVVAGYHELKLRVELKRVFPHEARSDTVAAGEGLDARLVPALALLGFRACHKARAHEYGQLFRVALVARFSERVHLRFAVVIGQDLGEYANKRAFP